MKVLIFATHPIQYQVPIYQLLAKKVDLKVVYLLKQSKKGQAEAGFGVEFEWDIPLLEGYQYEYLTNLSKNPSSSTMDGIILDPKEIDALFKREKPTAAIIHGWFPKSMKQLINYCYQNKIKSICRGDSTLLMTSNPIKKLAKEVYIRNILRKVNSFLYVGEENKKYYTHFGVKQQKLFAGLHCVNTDFFSEGFKNNPQKEFIKDKIVIGFSGKFIEKKQPLLLLKAIHNSKYKDLIKAFFIGDGPLRKSMKDFANKNKINLEITGFLNQTEIIKKGYSKIDTLVLPSKHNETWGLVVNEVMTAGILCIVSDKVGCHSDLIDEGKTGFTFKSGDVVELTKKIDLFVEMKRNEHSFKEDVKAKIENYSLENTVKGYLACLSSIK